MFKKIFGKSAGSQPKKGITQKIAKSDFELLEPFDENAKGVDAARFESGKVFVAYPEIRNAWFSKIKYADEDFVRLALLIDSDMLASTKWQEIASKCANIMAVDIIPNSVPPSVRATHKPLYINSENLFAIPILVNKGVNAEMPEAWSQAILNYFVADDDMENALLRALTDAKNQGYDTQSFFKEQVFKIEVDHWWDHYVVDRWENYKTYFMTQEEIKVFVKVGGLHLGPKVEWSEDLPTNSEFE